MGRDALTLSEFDYEFLKGEWEGPYGAAFNVVAEDCEEAGYYNGFYPRSSVPILTEDGRLAVDRYERNQVS